MESQAEPRGVQTALRAISILEAFSTARPALSLSEIAESVELAVPTTHRLLKALQSRHLVVMNPETRRYSLGYGVMQLARIIMQRDELANVAYPALERIRNETSETVSLQTLVGEQRVAVTELVSPHPIRMSSGIGTPYSLVRGAAGKAILAFLPKREVERLVAGSTDPEALAAELGRIRERGVATSYGEVVPGASSLAAPIFGSFGDVVASINVTGPSDRWTKDRIEANVPMLQQISAEITRQLGGIPLAVTA